MDNKAVEFFKKVQAARKALKDLEEPRYKTSKTITLPYSSNANSVISLTTVKDLDKLLEYFGHIHLQYEAYMASLVAFKLEEDRKFKFQSYTYEEWEHDFKILIERLSLNDRRKKLEDLETRLDNILTPEQKQELEIAVISKYIEDLDI